MNNADIVFYFAEKRSNKKPYYGLVMYKTKKSKLRQLSSNKPNFYFEKSSRYVRILSY